MRLLTKITRLPFLLILLHKPLSSGRSTIFTIIYVCPSLSLFYVLPCYPGPLCNVATLVFSVAYPTSLFIRQCFIALQNNENISRLMCMGSANQKVKPVAVHVFIPVQLTEASIYYLSLHQRLRLRHCGLF